MEKTSSLPLKLKPYLVKAIGLSLSLSTVIGGYDFLNHSNQENRVSNSFSSNDKLTPLVITNDCIPQVTAIADKKASNISALYPTGQVDSNTPTTIVVVPKSVSNISALYPTGRVVLSNDAKPISTVEKCVGKETSKFNLEMLVKSKVFTLDQVNQLVENSPIYESVAEKYNLPWQLLATIHWRETNLTMLNPENNNGLFQIYDSYFKPGQVSTSQFEEEVEVAAKLLTTKYSQNSNVVGNIEKDNSINMINIGNILMSYNGRSAYYSEQANSMGFSQPRLAFLGSPYVSNLINRNFNSAYNANWKQIRYDHGYAMPADQRTGTLAVFTLLMRATDSNINLDFSGINNSIKDSLLSNY